MWFWLIASLFCGIHALLSYASIWDDSYDDGHDGDALMIQSTLWWIAFFICAGKLS